MSQPALGSTVLGSSQLRRVPLESLAGARDWRLLGEIWPGRWGQGKWLFWSDLASRRLLAIWASGGVLAIGVLEVVHANPTGCRPTTAIGIASLDQAARLETTIGMPFFG